MKGLRLTEWLAVALLLTAIGVFVTLFLYEQNRTVEGESGEVIGELSFRYRVAERKFRDSVLWDPVDPGAPLHNQDWIRTDSYSEAVLSLKDGSTVEMYSETMLVLNLQDGKKEIQLKEGSVDLNLKGSYDLISGNDRILNLQGETRIRKEGDSLEIEQKEATATYEDTPLPAWASVENGVSKERTSNLSLISPVDSRTMVEGESASVAFQWSGPCPCKIHVIPSEPDRSRIQAESEKNELSLELKPGIYTWYVENNASRSSTRSFRLLEPPEIRAISPASEAELSIAGSSGLVRFSWDSKGLSRMHILEISRNADMSAPVEVVRTERSTVVLSLPKGDYYWRIKTTAIPDQQPPARGISSPVLSFAVREKKHEDHELAINLSQDVAASEEPKGQPEKSKNVTESRAGPVNERIWRTFARYPRPDAAVDMSERDSIPFQWTAVAGAEKYLFRLYRNDSILIERFVAQPYLEFTELTLLDTGWFEWSVEPFFADTRSTAGFQHRFQIILSQQLEKPELQE